MKQMSRTALCTNVPKNLMYIWQVQKREIDARTTSKQTLYIVYCWSLWRHLLTMLKPLRALLTVSKHVMPT